MKKLCEIGKRILAACKSSPTLFVGKKFNELNYRVYTPNLPKDGKVPLVLFLHGAGERGDDNRRQLKHAIGKVVKRGSKSPFMDAVVLAPQCPADRTWTSVDHEKGGYRVALTEETPILRQVVELVKAYLEYPYIDKDRVYVFGMSMGGYATWDLIARHPDLFAVAVPVCGGGPLDRAEQLKNFPVYVFHGRKDPIVRYEGSADMVDALLSAGSRTVVFKTYPHGRHNVWNRAITFRGDERLPALAEWLFAQTKKKDRREE